jgi:hypothetical protein
MSKDPLHGPKLKIERAKRHIRDLDTEIAAFHGRRPYEVIAQDDPQTGDQVFRVRIREEVPADLSGIIGDVIHNLRATFDLIAAEVVAANGGDRNQAYFPVSYTPVAFESGGRRKLKGASQEAIALVERTQPYHAGNGALLTLHKLDILDKHKSIIPVGAAHANVVITHILPVPWRTEPLKFPPLALRPANRAYPLKDGTPVFTIKAAARQNQAIDDNLKFTFEVAFGEGQIVDGRPVLPTLVQFVQFTEQTLDSFRRHLFS